MTNKEKLAEFLEAAEFYGVCNPKFIYFTANVRFINDLIIEYHKAKQELENNRI